MYNYLRLSKIINWPSSVEKRQRPRRTRTSSGGLWLCAVGPAPPQVPDEPQLQRWVFPLWDANCYAWPTLTACFVTTWRCILHRHYDLQRKKKKHMYTQHP